MNIFYAGYLGYGNVGDEVCYEAFQQGLNQWAKGNHHVVPYERKKQLKLKSFNTMDQFDCVVCGGGSLLQSTEYNALLKVAADKGVPVLIYGTGIDYFTEDYMKFLMGQEEAFKDMFARKEVVNIDLLREVMSKASYIGVRGPLTYKYLKKCFPENQIIKMMGDPAIVYHPERDDIIYQRYLSNLSPSKGFVAVNWGTVAKKLFGNDEVALRDRLIPSLYYLMDCGYHLVIYPMWGKDIPFCEELHSLLGKTPDATLIPEVYEARQIFWMLREMKFTINLKLHSNILSEAAEVPFISLAYRSKCVDFALSVDALDHTILTNSENILELIKRKEKEFGNHREQYKDTLRYHKNKYTELQKQFFEQFFS